MTDPQENNTAKVDWKSIVPEDSITIIIRSGERTYSQGTLLKETQELSVGVAQMLFERAIDTMDMIGIKKGGPKKDDRA